VQMPPALEIFDYCQTILMSLCLLITIPLACFVYVKLLVVRPFSHNYTFKLIVTNGIAQLLQSVMFLLNFQLTSFPFMHNYYTSIMKLGLAPPIAVIGNFLEGISLHTTLFVALNRMKTMIFIKKQSNDSVFFVISILFSTFLTLPTVLDYCFTTEASYVEITVGDSIAVLPSVVVGDKTLLTISFIVKSAVSLATLLVNIFLCILIKRNRQYVDIVDRHRFNGEKRLAMTSIVSYVFYMLSFVNNLLARYFNVEFCGIAQWFFLVPNSITPFWCLFIFTPSIRRLVVGRRRHVIATTV
ncbi:hypothetical protein PENTCL1PPCAC_9505, partial [Pristionchus entomophagus]